MLRNNTNTENKVTVEQLKRSNLGRWTAWMDQQSNIVFYPSFDVKQTDSETTKHKVQVNGIVQGETDESSQDESRKFAVTMGPSE